MLSTGCLDKNLSKITNLPPNAHQMSTSLPYPRTQKFGHLKSTPSPPRIVASRGELRKFFWTSGFGHLKLCLLKELKLSGENFLTFNFADDRKVTISLVVFCVLKTSDFDRYPCKMLCPRVSIRVS